MKQEQFKIEKNIPIPEYTSKAKGKSSLLRNQLEKMKVGDSVFIPGNSYLLLGNAKRAMNMNGRIFMGRVVEGGRRIWRTK